MGLKEWGQGLELLTDYYYRYAKKHSKNERWFTTGAIIGEKKKSGGTYPVEIDLIAFLVDNNCKIKQIHSVQCKEAVNGSNADELLNKFTINTVKTLLKHAEKKGILTKVVSYVKINDPSKKKLERMKGLELLSFSEMINDIRAMVKDYRTKKRKGYEQETVGWFYGSMYDKMIERQESKKKEATVEKNSQRKKDPKRSKGAKIAHRTMNSISWLAKNSKTKTAKRIMKKDPKKAKKVREKIRNLGS
jgi:hypothetical protein